MYFASDQLLAKHAPAPDDAEGWRNFYSSPEYAEIQRLQQSENADFTNQHKAYAERHGSSWTPERHAVHDLVLTKLRRGTLTGSEALSAMLQIHGSEHPLSRGSHLGPQFRD